MTIRELLLAKGLLSSPSATKALCPFHGDTHPSAKVDDALNSIYCFACRRLYGPADFMRLYGLVVDQVGAGPAQYCESSYEWGEPLFFA